MSAVIGYARVSTKDQAPDYQEKALREAGAVRIYTDRGESSRLRDRPQWAACLDYLRAGDTLLVHRLDRLGGDWHLFRLIEDLAERGINLRSLTEPVDTSIDTPMGRAFYGVVAVFAQLRIDTIRENTHAGLANARAHGRVGGRPSVITAERVQLARTMHAQGRTYTHRESARRLPYHGNEDDPRDLKRRVGPRRLLHTSLRLGHGSSTTPPRHAREACPSWMGHRRA